MKTKLNSSDKESVPFSLKGVGDGLCLKVDPVHPVDDIVNQAGKAFERLGHLTVNASVVLDSGDKETPDSLLLELEKFLKERFRVGAVTRAPKNKKKKYPKVNKQDNNNRNNLGQPADQRTSSCLIMAGRIRSGQRIVSENHLTIYGDVNPGAEVVACGDILILGSLKGSALAGQPNNISAIVLAFDFRPTQVQIGGYVAAGLPPLKETRIEFACVRDEHIEVKDYLKENPFTAMPFPIVRD